MKPEVLNNLDSMTVEELMQTAMEYTAQYGDEAHEVCFQIFQKAASLGDPAAAYSLAKCYEHGLGTEQDFVKAREWYERSDAQNYGHAPGALGNLYFLGQGVEKDLSKAFELYLRGAGFGSMEATYNAGMCYLYGYGVEEDDDKAYAYLSHAAKYGYKLAQQVLDDVFEEEEEE